MFTLSRRSWPVAPRVPVEVPRTLTAKPGTLASSAGRVQEVATQAPAVGRVAVRPAAGVNAPAAPVVEYSSCSVSGPVAVRTASKERVRGAEYPVVGTAKITPCVAAVYVVVP